MNINLSDKLLNLPIYIWIAQVTYVVLALILLYVLVHTIVADPKFNIKLFVILYVVGMLIVDIIWRTIVAHIIHW